MSTIPQLGSMSWATPAVSAAASTTSGSSTGAMDLGSTFLSLLTKELQNQDPTAPMDSTAMVGQMISLNQLNQLIAINQTLSQAASTAKGNTSTNGNSVQAAAASAFASAQNSAKTTQAAAPATASSITQLPFDPTTMMPLDPAHPAGVNSTAMLPLGGSTGAIQ